MTHAQTLHTFLTTASGPICDDCLSVHTGITPRQTVNLNARRLEARKLVARREAMVCAYCREHKVCNRANGTKPSMPVFKGVPEPPTAIRARPWHWEGHVQSALVTHLVKDRYAIVSAADTASKAAGKDIIAEKENRTLWVSVKGYPNGTARTRPPTQARHWFSHAVFDVVTYRNECANAELAIGLPDGYKTYHTLAERVSWLRANLPFSIYWVAEDGSVRREP